MANPKKSNKNFRYIAIGIFAVLAIILISLFIFISQKKLNEIKIGVIFPLSGTQAIGGLAGKNGVFLALEEINSKGGIKGKPINLVLEDSQGEAKTAVTTFTKLVLVDEVSVIIGPFLSTEAAAVSPLAEKYKVVLFSPTATTSVLNTAGDYVFKLREGNDIHMQKITEIMYDSNTKNIAVIYNNNEYCVDILNYFDEYSKKKGIKIVQKESYEQKDTDFRSQLTKIKSSKSDGIFSCGYYQDLGLVFKQIGELGLKKKAFSVTTFENKALIDIAGKNIVEGVVYTTSYFDCNKEAKDFCEKYKAKYGSEPDYRAALTYDALYIVSKAISDSKDLSPESIQKSLLKIQNYQGLTGLTSFDEEGNTKKEVLAKTVKDGKFVVLTLNG